MDAAAVEKTITQNLDFPLTSCVAIEMGRLSCFWYRNRWQITLA